MRMPTLCSFNTRLFLCVFLYSDQKQVYTNLFLFAKTNMYICMCMNRHFVEPSHVSDLPTLKFKTWHFVSTRNEKGRKHFKVELPYLICSIKI